MGSPYLIKAGLSESAPGLKCSLLTRAIAWVTPFSYASPHDGVLPEWLQLRNRKVQQVRLMLKGPGAADQVSKAL